MVATTGRSSSKRSGWGLSLWTGTWRTGDLFLTFLTVGWSMPTLPLRCSCSTGKAWITFNLVSKVMAALMLYQYRQQPQPCEPTLCLFTWAGSPSKLDESQLWYAYRYCNYISHHSLKEIQVIQLVHHRRILNWTYCRSKSGCTTFI